MANFEELEVWKRSSILSADLYTYFKSLKDYGFRDQITRAGLSIPSNTCPVKSSFNVHIFSSLQLVLAGLRSSI